jgi:hypothetical protein
MEKVDLERDKMEADQARAAHEAATAANAASAVPQEVEGPDFDALIAKSNDDIRDMVKALADELARFGKDMAALQKDEAAERKAEKAEPIDTKAIVAEVIKAIEPVMARVEQKSEVAEKPVKKTFKINRDAKGNMVSVEQTGASE